MRTTTNSTVEGEAGRLPVWLVAGAVVAGVGAVILLPGDYRAATALGIVQGLGEFLPISSSAHLIVAPWLFGFESSALNNLTYDVALHLGTTIAGLAFFWRDWLRLGLHAFKPRTPDGRFFWLLVLASIPGAVAGYLLDDIAETSFRSPLLVAITLATMGAVLYLVDHNARQRKLVEDVDARDALAVGFAQALALVPGVSRSGSTITMARLLGLRRDAAARLSFLLATPITAGALLFKLKDVDPTQIGGPFITGIVVSGIVGALSIGLLLRFISKRSNSYLPFALYRFGLSALILIVYLVRGR